SSTGGTTGSTDPSPNGTRGARGVDATGAIWTRVGTHTLRNGVWVGGGNAQEYLYFNSTVYAINADGVWKWNEAWSFVATDITAVIGGASTPKLPRVASDFAGNRTSAILWRNSKTGANAIWMLDKGAV